MFPHHPSPSRWLLLVLLAAFSTLSAQAQGVTIGAAGAPAASAALEVRSTSQGLLLPRLTSAQRAAIAAPVAGLMLFQTDNTPGMYYYDGSAWLNLTTGTVAPLAGVASTLAGSGTAGSADGIGPAAQFNNPNGVACDGSGNLYVADQSNHGIRRIVIATGQAAPLAGSGTAGYVDATGASAQFNNPTGVAYDVNGNLYITDQGNNRIRTIAAGTATVSTLAGSTPGYADATGTAARFRGPTGVACDGSGNLYVADQSNQRIRRIVIATGAVSTLAGSGTAGLADGLGAAAQFNYPYGVAYDVNGNVYVADTGNHSIRVVK